MANLKIVSGGQTGVDQGALEAAAQLGLEFGGWAPARWLAEKPLGAIPGVYRKAMREPFVLSVGHCDFLCIYRGPGQEWCCAYSGCAEGLS